MGKKTFHMKNSLLIFSLSLMFLSCANNRYTQVQLYFGRAVSDKELVSDSAWRTFVKGYIQPVFNEGFTITENKGNWYDTVLGKMIEEPSMMVTCVTKLTPGLSKRIDSIGYWYKIRYQQQAVLRVDSRAKVIFL